MNPPTVDAPGNPRSHSGNDPTLSFWEHLDELRSTFVRVCIIIALGTALCLFFYQGLFAVLTYPFQNLTQKEATSVALSNQTLIKKRITNQSSLNTPYTLPEGSGAHLPLNEGVQQIEEGLFLIPVGSWLDIETVEAPPGLLILGPVQGFTSTLKVCCLAGMVGTSPLWLFLIMSFIRPALQENKRYSIIPFVAISVLLVALGVLFSYFVTIPISNKFLYAFNASIGTNLWSLEHYLNYTVLLMLAHAIAFEAFVILLFLAHFGVLSAETMAKFRRHVIVVIFILAALLTPPDVPSQIMLAIPMMLLYEAVILYARLRRNYQPQI